MVNSRPEYKSANRTYTPSYNNPRMSTRPSYNNSRVSDGSGSNTRQGSSSVEYRAEISIVRLRSETPRTGSFNQSSGNGQKSSSFSNMQRRYSTPSSSSKQYSVPSRRSSEAAAAVIHQVHQADLHIAVDLLQADQEVHILQDLPLRFIRRWRKIFILFSFFGRQKIILV